VKFIIFIPFRNRCAEQAKHMLPTKKRADGDEVDEMGLTEAELQYMIKNRTLELPANFFRRFVKTKRNRILEYTGFEVRDCFPQNVVRMKTGQIVFCNKFSPPTQPGGDVMIHGFQFLGVRDGFPIFVINFNEPSMQISVFP
jgi:hypothetical protein